MILSSRGFDGSAKGLELISQTVDLCDLVRVEDPAAVLIAADPLRLAAVLSDELSGGLVGLVSGA